MMVVSHIKWGNSTILNSTILPLDNDAKMPYNFVSWLIESSISHPNNLFSFSAPAKQEKAL